MCICEVSNFFLKMCFFVFFSSSYHSFMHAGQTEGGKLDFFEFFFFFTFGMAPEMRKRWNWKQKTKWRPLLAQASDLAGFVCLNFFSKGKIAKRVVWMIALAGCAQAGWIARGTRPEQGEPIYILCNLFYIMCTVRHI